MFFWKDDYSLGIEAIDAQHKELFVIANKVLALNPESLRNKDYEPDREMLKGVLHHLYDYVKRHFHDEEEYMRQIGYPELPHHIQTHEHIINEMNVLLKQSPNLRKLEIDLVHFLNQWIVTHIMDEDKKIRIWLDTQNKI